MRTSRLIAIITAGVVLSFAPAAAVNAAEQPEGAVAVSGTVYDPATGNPVSNAPVTISVFTTGYVPAADGVGNDSCEELYPNAPAETETDGLGDYQAELLAYPGSEQCEFVIVGNAVLPSGEVVKRSQAVTGLNSGARVPMNIPQEGGSVPAESGGSAVSDDANSGGSSFPILLPIAVVLGVVALVAFLLWLTVLVARAAQRKGRSFWAWFWIAFFFLIPAAIIVAIMGPKPEYVVSAAPTPVPSTSSEPTKRCPFCGEEVLAVARKCKHCGEFLATE